MKTKLTRWALSVMAVAALSVAALVPAASSASAATVKPTAATGVWINLEAYPGTYPLDLLDCVLGYEQYWSHVYPLTPESDFRCLGQLYTPILGEYYELQIFL